MKNIKKFKMFLEGKENNKKIEGTLPFFPGFYNTQFGEFERQENDMIEYYNEENSTNYTYDDFDWSYSEVFNEVARLCFDTIEPMLLKLPFVEKMTYDGSYSPKQYNYRNDAINVTYGIDYDAMKKYFLEDSTLEEIEEYSFDDDLEYKVDYINGCIKSEYTSGPGFTSHYSNDVSVWLKGLFTGDLEDTQLNSLIEYASLFEDEMEEKEVMVYDGESLFDVIDEEFNTLQPKMEK